MAIIGERMIDWLNANEGFVMTVLTLVYAIATLIYVFFTYRISKANECAVSAMREQLGATKDAAEATLVRAFLDDYFSQGISDAMRLLQDWKAKNGDDFAAAWLKHLQASDDKARQVDQARRLVKAYFEKAARIFSAELIRPKILQKIAYVAAINIYYDIIDPLERELNPGKNAETIELLMKHCGRHNEGELIRTVSLARDQQPNEAVNSGAERV